MKKIFRVLIFYLLFFLTASNSFARDRRRDFTNGHYREAIFYSFDSKDLVKDTTNYDIESVSVRRQRDTLIVMLFFTEPPVAKAGDKIIIMINNMELGQGATIFKTRGKKNAATKMKTYYSVEYYAWESVPHGIVGGNLNSSAEWIFDEQTETYSTPLPVITYKIPTSSLRDDFNNHLSTDNLSMVILFSADKGNGKTSVMDAIPFSACTLSSDEIENDSLELDFSKGLEILGLTTTR